MTRFALLTVLCLLAAIPQHPWLVVAMPALFLFACGARQR